MSLEEAHAEKVQPGSPTRVRIPKPGLAGLANPRKKTITVLGEEGVQLEKLKREESHADMVVSTTEEDWVEVLVESVPQPMTKGPHPEKVGIEVDEPLREEVVQEEATVEESEKIVLLEQDEGIEVNEGGPPEVQFKLTWLKSRMKSPSQSRFPRTRGKKIRPPSLRWHERGPTR